MAAGNGTALGGLFFPGAFLTKRLTTPCPPAIEATLDLPVDLLTQRDVKRLLDSNEKIVAVIDNDHSFLVALQSMLHS